MNEVDAITQEIRTREQDSDTSSPYNVGKRDGYRAVVMMLEAVQNTEKCPRCGKALSLKYSEKLKELVKYCDEYGCNYDIILNQIRY